MTASEEFVARWVAHAEDPLASKSYVPAVPGVVIIELIERLADVERRLAQIERSA